MIRPNLSAILRAGQLGNRQALPVDLYKWMTRLEGARNEKKRKEERAIVVQAKAAFYSDADFPPSPADEPLYEYIRRMRRVLTKTVSPYHTLVSLVNYVGKWCSVT